MPCAAAVESRRHSVEFFNLILGTKLTPQEKKDFVAFMLTL
jgi:hypothetical protein